jgi:hypothetical protein
MELPQEQLCKRWYGLGLDADRNGGHRNLKEVFNASVSVGFLHAAQLI